MPTKKKQTKREGYSLKEIKEKYFPNKDMRFLEQQETSIKRDDFLNMLEEVSRPTDEPEKAK